VKQEYLTRPDVNLEIVLAYASTFISRYDTYPIQNADGSYVQVKCPLVPPIIEGYLKGHITIGAYALNEDSEAQWICFDAGNDDHAFELSYMATTLAKNNVPSYLEKSRRGCHLWFFTPHSQVSMRADLEDNYFRNTRWKGQNCIPNRTN